MILKFGITMCLMMLSATAVAQDLSIDADDGILQRIGKMINRSGISHGVDTNYIKIPKQPWQVSVKSRVAQTDLQMHSTIDGGAVYGPILENHG